MKSITVMLIASVLLMVGCQERMNHDTKKTTGETTTAIPLLIQPQHRVASSDYLQLLEANFADKANSKNLLSNPGFEIMNKKKGVPLNWNGLKCKGFSISPQAFEGERCAKLALDTKPSWSDKCYRNSIIQDVDIDSGAYELTFEYKGMNLMELIAKIQISKPGEKLKAIRKDVQFLSDPKGWTKQEFLFLIPKGWRGERLIISFLGKVDKKCSAYIDNVSLRSKTPTTNLVCNSSFEICTTPETPDHWISSAGQLLDTDRFSTTMVSDTAHTGKHSVRMRFDGELSKPLATLTRLRSGFCPDVDEGVKYTVSMWMKTDNPPVTIDVSANYVNRNTFVLDSKKWKRYSFTAVWRRPDRKTRFAYLLFAFGGKYGDKVDANVWIDDVMAERGTQLTAWKPALRDLLYLRKGTATVQTKKNTLSTPETGKYPHLKAVKIKSGIVVDGKLDDVAWKVSEQAHCSTPYKNKSVTCETDCRISYDDDAMYIGLTARREHDPTSSEKLKNTGVFSGDWIEIFLDPNAKDAIYHQFAINENGKLFTLQSTFDPISFETPGASGYLSDPSWRPEIEYKVSRNDENWTAEIKIPLNLFKSEMKTGAPFRLNFYRVNTYSGEANCWVKPSRNFHSIIDYGYLDNFEAPRNLPDVKISPILFYPSPSGEKVNGSFSITGKNDVKKVVLELLASNGAAQQLKTERKGTSFSFTIPYSVKKSKNRIIRIKAYSGNDNETAMASAQSCSSVKIVSLLTLSVNTLVFQDENTFPCCITTRIPKAEFSKCSLKLSAIDRKTGKLLISKSFPIKKETAVHALPIKNLPDGYYTIEAQLLTGGKALAKDSKWTYLGKRVKNYARVDIRKNARLEMNGKTFFPLSLWFTNPTTDVNLRNLKKFRQLGMNTVLASVATYFTTYDKSRIDDIFKMAEKNNLSVMIDFYDLLRWSGRRKIPRAKVLAIVKEIVEKYRNHPNLLMYFGMDEWVVGRYRKRPFCSDEDLRDVYWTVKKADPHHPFIFNMCPRPEAWGDLRFTDMFSYDCYVTANSPKECDLNRFLFILKKAVRRSKDEGKPMLNVIQFDSSTETLQSRMLTYQEQRCLNYVTVLNDAIGIGYFCGICWCEYPNRKLAKINKEISLLAPILKEYDQAERIKGGNDIMAKWYKYKGAYYVIAVNTSSAPTTGVALNLSGTTLRNCEMSGVFGTPPAHVKGKQLTLSFAPYECKILKWTP